MTGFNRFNGFGQGADLINFYQQGVTGFLFNRSADALGVGNKQVISNNLNPVAKGIIQLAEQIELVQRTPAHILIGLDITSGRERELMKDRTAVTALVNQLRSGDTLSIYLIHSRAESDQEEVFKAEMPQNSGPMGQELSRKQLKAQRDWECCWREKIMPLIHSDEARLKQQTDIFGFLRFVSSQKPEFRDSTRAYLILYTDGQHVGDGFNFERRAPTGREIDLAERNDLMPDLRNIRLFFAGVTPTHQISNEHWRRIQRFWKEYGRASGASSVSVLSERAVGIR